MKSHRWLACAAVLLASTPAFAFDYGIGLEGAGTLSLSKGLSGGAATDWSGAGGIILEERLSVAIVELTLWEDVQMPYALNIVGAGSGSILQLSGGAAQAAQYIPIDVGLRLGLALGLLHPYVGILGNYSLLSSSQVSGGGDTAQSFWGLGGDLGLDLAVLFFRFGLEVRAFWSLTNVVSGPPPAGGTVAGGALEVQGLLSARLSF